MTRLRIGIHSDLREHGDQAAVYRETLDLFTRAEELGFEGAWVRSYKFRRTSGTPGFSFPGGLPSPFPFLGALASRTSRIRLGTAVVPLPLENVVRVAEDAAVLDAISGGRLELGVSNGGTAPGLAELFRGVPGGRAPESRRAAYQADLALLADALAGGCLNKSGQRLNPPSPGLADRIWEATLSEQSGFDTGARGHGVLIGTTQTVPAEVTARAYFRGLERYSREHGPRPPRVGIATLIYPAKDRPTALREARAGIEEKYAWGQAFLPPATTLAGKAAAICLHYGTAEQITESVLAQPWLGYATQLMVQTELFYPSYAHRADALELFTRDVAPALGWARAPQGAPAG